MFEGIDLVAIILAAGSGRRMNAGVNKVWLEIQGKSILERSIEAFRSARFFKKIVLVASSEEFAAFESFLASRTYREQVVVVAGGTERQHSVRNVLQYLRTWSGWTGSRRLVAIHDAVRPLITVELLQRGISAALEYNAVGLAVPLKDTVKMVDLNQMVVNTPDRSYLWAMQTPQIFDFELITACHQKAAESGLLFTDDCSVVEYAGYPVKLVRSSYENIKITTPEDLQFATALLSKTSESNSGVVS